MESLRVISTKKIGSVWFSAYLVEEDNRAKAFAVYFQKISTPLLLFQRDKPSGKMEIIINDSLLARLHKLKSIDSALRKKYYEEFKAFVLDAEHDAKEIIFKGTKLEYITDVRLIKRLEKEYFT